MTTLLKVLGSFLAFAGFILFVSWMDRPQNSPASVPVVSGATTTGPGGSADYRLVATPEATIHELTDGDSIRFGLRYSQGGALLTDSEHLFKADDNDAIKAVKELGERPANASNGAVFVSPGGEAGGAAATVSLVDRPPPAAGFDDFVDVDLPAPSGQLLLAPNGDTYVTDVIELPEGDYRARIRVRGPANGEDVRIDLWPASATS